MLTSKKKNLSSSEGDLKTLQAYDIERISFKHIWSAKISTRQHNDIEAEILQISPKFATVHGQVAFQWSLHMNGTIFYNEKKQMEQNDGNQDELESGLNYIALSLYFNDGPTPIINDLKTTTKILQNKKYSIGCKHDGHIVAEEKNLSAIRGKGTELITVQNLHFSNYVKKSIGQVVRLSIELDFPAELFEPSTYLNTLTQTPITSFLLTNYRARASSKVFKRPSQRNKLLKKIDDDSHQLSTSSTNKHDDFEHIFELIMNEEKELSKTNSVTQLRKCDELKNEFEYKMVLFKKLLMACCDGCQKKAEIMGEENQEIDHEEMEGLDDENAFECNDDDKDSIHEKIANMFFTNVVLPDMAYIAQFTDFLHAVESNNFPILKRICEGYLCSELNSNKDIRTLPLLELLFLAIVFNLKVLESMTLSALSGHFEELDEPNVLLALDEYKNLDFRMTKLNGTNLAEVIGEVQRFRQQMLRTELIGKSGLSLPYLLLSFR